MDNTSQSVARPGSGDRLAYFTQESDCLIAASEMLKSAGFIYYQTSMKSEAVYYKFPGRREVLRVSSHSRNKQKTLYGLDTVATSLTINFRGCGKRGLRVLDIENRVAMAIGYFMLRSTLGERGGMVDAAGLNPVAEVHAGSNPAARTNGAV